MIIINKEWSLTNDEHSVTLLKNQRPIGYYPNFETALKAMIDKNIQNLDELKHMCEKLDTLRDHINQIFNVSSSSHDSNNK